MEVVNELFSKLERAKVEHYRNMNHYEKLTNKKRFSIKSLYGVLEVQEGMAALPMFILNYPLLHAGDLGEGTNIR